MKLAQDYPAVSPEELNKTPFPSCRFIAVIRLPDAFAVFTVYAAEEEENSAVVLSDGDAQRLIRHCAILPAPRLPHGRLSSEL